MVLRRAGWAVVVVDEMGNIKSASYGAVPSDVLSEQTSRCAEDYAAMAGPLTLDPLTHRANGKRAHVSSRLLCCHDEVRPVKVEGQATEADVDRYDEDRWEVQMLGAEVEAKNEGKNQWAPDDDETAPLENDSEGNEAHSKTMREMAQ